MLRSRADMLSTHLALLAHLLHGLFVGQHLLHAHTMQYIKQAKGRGMNGSCTPARRRGHYGQARPSNAAVLPTHALVTLQHLSTSLWPIAILIAVAATPGVRCS